MSILDDNYAERTDKLFLMGRWLPLTPRISKLWILPHPFEDGSTYNNPIEVDVNYAKELCNHMFDGLMSLYELWELIGGIEVSPDWISNWHRAAGQTLQEDMGKWNELLNKELIQKIANALVERFAGCDMHVMSLDEFGMMHIWPPTCMDDDWFCYEPGILLHADWFVFPAYIKIMTTSNGIGFGLLYESARPASWDVHDMNDLNNPFVGPRGNYWDYNLFVLDLSPEKGLLSKPRDIDEFMMYQPTSRGMLTRYNQFNQQRYERE